MINDTSLLKLLITSSLSLGLMACNKSMQTRLQDSQNQVIATSPPLETSPALEPAVNIDYPVTEPLSEVTPKPVVTPKREPLPANNRVKDTPAAASSFIIVAYNTLVNEGKKLGAACNFYIQGVLKNLGFKVVDFLANDFDAAAEKMFKTYRVVTFTNATELKRHIWSYRERTGFIFQWERPGGAPGHVGIVERIGEKLYIYQASLNRYTARVEVTTLDRLLAVNDNRGLRVYSEFIK